MSEYGLYGDRVNGTKEFTYGTDGKIQYSGSGSQNFDNGINIEVEVGPSLIHFFDLITFLTCRVLDDISISENDSRQTYYNILYFHLFLINQVQSNIHSLVFTIMECYISA